MKRNKTNAPRSGTSPYKKGEKKPFSYSWQRRLAGGDLSVKANDRLQNRYA